MKVLIGNHLSDEERADVQSAVPGARICLTTERAAVLREIADAEAYVPGPFDAELLAAAPALRWVHYMWAGLDGALFPELVESGVTVTNSAGVFAVPMAEHALALMLAFARGLHLCARRSPERLWHAEGARHAVASTVTELNGLRVIAVRSRPRTPDGCADTIYGPDGLWDALAQCDYVLISCALTPATRGLIGADELAHVKASAVLVNVARGAIVDEAALIAALKSGKLGGAGLDVTAQEPLPADSPLWTMENVVISPHVSGSSPRTRERQLALVRENLRRWAAGEPLLNIVNKHAGY